MSTNKSYETNESLQRDEIDALSAIFNEEWVLEDISTRSFSIQIQNSCKNSVYLKVVLPSTYPLESPPNYYISAPWMSKTHKERLYSEIEDIYVKHAGESIIYMWIEKVRDFIEKEALNSSLDLEKALQHDHVSENPNSPSATNLVDELPEILHGETITDRKSIFQAHLAKVYSVNQVNQVMEKLKENRKIALATHNISAYRISRDKKAFIQDCDDDGETKAGGVLLGLLQILDVSDVFIVVSRWYGGIHLGPDRFKHIKNAARNLLSSSGLLEKDDKVMEDGEKRTRKKKS